VTDIDTKAQIEQILGENDILSNDAFESDTADLEEAIRKERLEKAEEKKREKERKLCVKAYIMGALGYTDSQIKKRLKLSEKEFQHVVELLFETN